MSTKLDHYQRKNNKSALLAVSGGVDSIVLLDLLGKALDQHGQEQEQDPDPSEIKSLISVFVEDTGLSKIELAYIDHSQRTDTGMDIKATRQLADQFNLKLHVISLDLPKDCSEQLARQKRYEALEQTKLQRALDHIITAHHADDVLETAITNMTRGTGPKGLSSLHHQPDNIWRPFLYKLKEGVYICKKDILDYAHANKLGWHEDSTNASDKYLRNRIRQRLAKQKPEEKLKLLSLISANLELREEISQNTQLLELTLSLDGDQTYSIPLFRELPEEVKSQFLHTKISQNGFDVNKESVDRAKEFIQTKTTGKTLQLKGCELKIPKKDTFSFISLVN